MTSEDIKICKITLKLIFCCNLCNRSGSLIYPPAHQHVLAIPLIFNQCVPFEREIHKQPETNTCRVFAILFMTSNLSDVGKQHASAILRSPDMLT